MGLIAPPPRSVAQAMQGAFLPGAIGLATVDGVFFGPPTENMMRGLLLNERLFEEAGMVPEAPVTWAQLAAVSRKLRRVSVDGKLEVTGLFADDGHQSAFMGPIVSLAWSNGAQFVGSSGTQVTVNTGPWRETFHFLQSMFVDGSAAARGQHGGRWFFREEQAGMELAAGPWLRHRYGGWRGYDWLHQIASAPLPAGSTGRPVSHHYGYVLAVTTHSQHPQRAWEFIRWLTTERQKNGTTRMGSVTAHLGSIPVTRDDALNHPLVREKFLQGFMEIVSQGYTRTTTQLPNINFFGILHDHMRPALRGETSVEGALDDVQRVLQASLQEYLAREKGE